MSGRPVIGLVLALVVEARHWTRLRWDFDEDACGRAWQLTTLAIALAAVLVWLDGNRYTALPNLLSWMPALLLPMQFIQSYGMRDSLMLSTFSFLARRRRERNLRLGLIEETTRFNFGNVLFATCMVAAAVGSRADTWAFLAGVVILTGWSLLGSRNSTPLSLVPVLGIATIAAFGGRIGIERLEERLGRTGAAFRGRFDPVFCNTLIGRAGPVEQSPDIVWRLRPAPGSVPPFLLRTGTFNTFIGTNWQVQRVPATDFKDLDTRLIRGEPHWLLDREEEVGTPDGVAAPRAAELDLSALPAFNLRGSAAEESPLPLPGDTAALSEFELDGIERNTFGTVRIYPKHTVIDGTAFWKGGGNPEFPPIAKEDLRVPIAEKEIVRETVEELGLHAGDDLRLTLAVLRTWFHKEFRYSRNLTIRYGLDGRPGPTALMRFLTDVRSGHCEYFATAAVLLLRELGVPARYATGYAVLERDAKRGGFVIRGTHGHAWCRVWDQAAGRWIDFDPTPPAGLASGSPPFTAMQRFNDAIKRVREDFFVWRNRPGNRLGVTLAMLGVGLALTAFIARRLWHTKQRLDDARTATGYEGPVIRTPLHDLEGQVRKRLGGRLPGQPFGAWLAGLASHLPETKALEEAIALHQRLRFDPQPAPTGCHERLAELTARLAAELRLRRTAPTASPRESVTQPPPFR